MAVNVMQNAGAEEDLEVEESLHVISRRFEMACCAKEHEEYEQQQDEDALS
eukprot:CAMPEP_0119083712 /NCGR_PEP_ID=MMETSP1178-20130426/126711_1 /TAXON_ID=33656 /ORGANISM="unid sp, Strain CCMP2000" /LENGTH=50 /DNA_ID=CAMNT_0007066601 /DNA_START=32 /DNA_END=181 /DNA_ORIENTATION=+